jgi:3-deoxy-7-phosphoheptulonate synthase
MTVEARAIGAVQRDGALSIFAGPCSIESREQIMEVAAVVAEAGIKILRGGAYKPRTSPYSFQGLEEEGLKLLAEAGERYGLLTCTEVVDSAHAELVDSYVDILQIGTRNMSNFSLLKKIGAVTADSKKPVLFKRGWASTIDEWLGASEYITMHNPNAILCERGIRTFETATRFTLDISAVPVVKKLCNLRHGAGGLPGRGGGRSRRSDDRGPPQPSKGPLRRPPIAGSCRTQETGRRTRTGGEVHRQGIRLNIIGGKRVQEALRSTPERTGSLGVQPHE